MEFHIAALEVIISHDDEQHPCIEESDWCGVESAAVMIDQTIEDFTTSRS